MIKDRKIKVTAKLGLARNFEDILTFFHVNGLVD